MADTPIASVVAHEIRIAKRLRGEAIERPHEEVPMRVPIALRTVQHSWISDGLFEPSWSKRMIMAKWLIAGEAEMGVAGRWIPMPPGHVAIYIPSIRHQFRAIAPVNEFCWFTVDGTLAEAFVLALGLEPGVYANCPAPVEQIHELMASMSDATPHGRRASSLMSIRLWYQIAEQVRMTMAPSEIQKAQHIIQQELANQNLSATSIAERLHFHRGSLSRLFHKHTGMTIMDYITEVRLQEAKSLLLHTNDKISEIARKCGFRETAYFCRWLRKHTGYAPGELRRAPETLV